jgi:branched-chain amino acid transport system ATP-binding protein
MGEPALLEVAGVDARYGDLQALWEVSLSVREREIVTLIGPNGAGKTTMLRAIAGLHPPSGGTINLRGGSISSLSAHEIVERGVILVPEGRRLFGGMTVLENLEMGAFSSRARTERQRSLLSVYEIFPLLAERKGQRAATLSGGQQQMLAVGRALMGLPELLLLDEPSLGLAPIVVDSIFTVVREINERGVGVLLVEQNARMAMELASRAYVLEQGRVVLEGATADLLADERVQEAYLGTRGAEMVSL